MKKFGLGLSLALVLVLVFAVTAMAYTNPHGNYSVNTAACASCHTTHTAQGSKLFKFVPAAGAENDNYRTCMYCHDGTGSVYDEKNGQIKGATGNFNTSAGGFVNMTTVEGATGVAATASASSIHQVNGANGATYTIPGGSQNASGKYKLECSSCHDPHGTTNDRALVTTVSVFNTAGTSWQTVSTSPAKITITTANKGENEQVTWGDNYLSNFCGACHSDYLQTAAGSGSATSGTYDTTKYRHRVAGWNGTSNVSVLSSAASGYNATYYALPTATGGNLTCMTCHYAHGTNAAVSGTTYANGSTLLRMDERGVCQNCHNKTPDTTTKPTVVTASSSQPDKTHIVLTYSTYMEKTAAELATNYTLNGGLTVSSVALQSDAETGKLGKTVVITLGGAGSTTGTSYTVTVNTTNVKDLNGNAVSATGNTFTFTGK